MTGILKALSANIFSFGGVCVSMFIAFCFLFYLIVQSDIKNKSAVAACYEQQMIAITINGGTFCVAPGALEKVK